MAVIYADEVRRNLKNAKQDLKGLSDQWADRQKERTKKMALLSTISNIGQRGSDQIDSGAVRQEITRLDREIRRLTVEIDKQQKRCGALNEKVGTAPKRPKTRSHVASIAASGSREINEKARQFDIDKTWTTWKRNTDRGTPESVLWAAGMAAAKNTAKKYGIDFVPESSVQIMKCTLDNVLAERKAPIPVARKHTPLL